MLLQHVLRSADEQLMVFDRMQTPHDPHQFCPGGNLQAVLLKECFPVAVVYGNLKIDPVIGDKNPGRGKTAPGQHFLKIVGNSHIIIEFPQGPGVQGGIDHVFIETALEVQLVIAVHGGQGRDVDFFAQDSRYKIGPGPVTVQHGKSFPGDHLF